MENKKLVPPPLPGKVNIGTPQQQIGLSKPPFANINRQGLKPPVVSPPFKPGSAGPDTGIEPNLFNMQQESQIQELQRQLMEERERFLLQTVKSKEEEVLTTKVEESIREIQDKLRKEKYVQELQEQLTSAQMQIKDLERKVGEERDTWVQTLKSQLTQRDMQEKDLDQTFQIKLHELERKWQDEKGLWLNNLRRKEDDISKLKGYIQTREDELKFQYETKITGIEMEKNRVLEDTKILKEEVLAKEKEITVVKSNLSIATGHIRKQDDEILRHSKILEKLEFENRALVQKIDSKEKEYYILKTQAQLLTAKYKAEQDKLFKELETMKLSLVAKDNEINSLKQLYDSQQKDLKHDIEDREKEVNVLKVEIDNLKNMEKDLLVQKAEYGQKISNLQEHINERNISLENIKSAFTEKTGEFKNYIGNLEKQIADKQREIEKSAQYEKNNSNLAGEIAGKQKEIDSLIQEKNRINEEKNSIFEQIRAHTDEIKNKTAAIESLNREINVSNIKMADLNNKISLLEDKAKDSEKRNFELQQVVERDKNESRRLQEIIDSKDRSMNELKGELKDFDRIINDKMREERINYESKIQYFDRQTQSLQNDIIRKDQSVTDLMEREELNKKRLIEQIQNKDREISGLLAQISKFEKEDKNHGNVIEVEMIKVKTGYENTINQITEKMNTLQKEYAQKLEQKEHLVKELNNKISSMDVLFNDKIKVYEDSHKRKLSEIDSLLLKKENDHKQVLTEKESEYAKKITLNENEFTAQKAGLISKYVPEIDMLNQKLKLTFTQIQEQRNILAKQEEKYTREMEKVADEWRVKINDKDTEIQKAREEKTKQESKISQLNTKISDLQKKIVILENIHDNLVEGSILTGAKNEQYEHPKIESLTQIGSEPEDSTEKKGIIQRTLSWLNKPVVGKEEQNY